MVDILKPIQGHHPATKRLKDLGDGSFAEVVAMTPGEDITLTGDVIVDTFGELNDAAVTNPAAASATMPALLRGLLSVVAKEGGGNLAAIAAALGAAGDAAGDPTVIGLLKQIAANTD